MVWDMRRLVIVVDEDGSVRPDQVMWAISVKVNPAGDVIMLPNMSENLLDPACQPSGIVHCRQHKISR